MTLQCDQLSCDHEALSEHCSLTVLWDRESHRTERRTSPSALTPCFGLQATCWALYPRLTSSTTCMDAKKGPATCTSLWHGDPAMKTQPLVSATEINGRRRFTISASRWPAQLSTAHLIFGTFRSCMICFGGARATSLSGVGSATAQLGSGRTS